jgi:hypothetical protein
LPVPGVEPGSLSPLRTCQIIPYGTTTPRCLHLTCCICRPNMNPSGIRRHQGPVWNAEFRMSDSWCGRRRVDLVSAYAVAYRPSTLSPTSPSTIRATARPARRVPLVPTRLLPGSPAEDLTRPSILSVQPTSRSTPGATRGRK